VALETLDDAAAAESVASQNSVAASETDDADPTSVGKSFAVL
jgi:hypothetical protein